MPACTRAPGSSRLGASSPFKAARERHLLLPRECPESATPHEGNLRGALLICVAAHRQRLSGVRFLGGLFLAFCLVRGVGGSLGNILAELDGTLVDIRLRELRLRSIGI